MMETIGEEDGSSCSISVTDMELLDLEMEDEDDDLDVRRDTSDRERDEKGQIMKQYGAKMSSRIDDLTMVDIDSESESDGDDTNTPHVMDNVEEWKLKKAMQKRSSLLKKISQCSTRITLLEKDRNSQIFSKRSEFRKHFVELEELCIKMNSVRGIQKKKLKEQLQRISSGVHKFQREIEIVKPSHASVEKVKKLMEEVEEGILKFKEQQRLVYEEMLQSEKILTTELDAFSKKVDLWSQRQAASAERNIGHPSENNSEDKFKAPPEVKEFERFIVQTGGHQGGWDDVDHQTYLKVRRQHKTDEDFYRAVETALPVRSKNDIVEHDQWYKEYKFLREKKRKAIQAWKSMKEIEKQEILSKAGRDMSSEDKRENKRKELIEKEKQDRFAKLGAWKLQRDKEQREKEEMERQRLKVEESRKQEDTKKQAEVKRKVQSYIQQKKEEDKIMREILELRQAEAKAARKLTRDEVERIRERDKRMLEEKQERLRKKEEEKLEKEKRLERLKQQVKVNIDRDPGRLYKPTQGWKRRQEATKESAVAPVSRMPHRAVPSWRQGLS